MREDRVGRADRTGGTTRARRLRNGAAGFCLLACLLLIGVCASPGLRVSLAQSASTMSEAAQAEAARAQAKSSGEMKANAADAQAPAADQPLKQAAVPITDPRQKQIADDTADLLKLANSLKAEVDKTNEDTLSVAVVRQAGEIEKLAHKMRTK
jgi:hypothetical protein